MGCNMCVVRKPEEQHRARLQVKEAPRRGAEAPRGGGVPRGPLVLQVLRRGPRAAPPGAAPRPAPPPPPPPPAPPPPPPGAAAPPPPGLVDSGTQTDISFESRLGAEAPLLPPDYLDPAELPEGAGPEELEYEEVELCKERRGDKLGLTVCYRTDGEEDGGIYVGQVNPNSIAAKDGRIREGDRIIQINGVEVQDRGAAVAFLTREQPRSVALLVARPDGQRWRDSDRDDFLDGSASGSGSEDGERRPRGPWTPPGEPPGPGPPCARGAEPDSGVGRTDESTRNEESSEHDLLGEEAAGPPPAARRAPGGTTGSGTTGGGGTGGRTGSGTGSGTGPARPPRGPARERRSAARAGAGPAGRAGAGGGAAGAGTGPAGRAGAAAGMGMGPPGRGGAGAAAGLGAGPAGSPGAGCGAAAAGGGRGGARSAEAAAAALSQAELRRYRQLRGRLAPGPAPAAASPPPPAASRAELALLEEELRHLEFKCRHLLRAHKMQRLRERCLRAWLEASGAAGLADISEVPERDSSSAYNTGESCRSSPLRAPPESGPAGGPAKGARGKRPGRDRLLKARAVQILEERGGGSTTEEDARQPGRAWSREQRRLQVARAREQRRRREGLGHAAAGGGAAGGVAGGAGAERGAERRAAGGGALRRRSRRILGNWAAIQELLARGGAAPEGGRPRNPLLSVTTV